METLRLVGIDTSLFIGFVLANLLSWIWADKVIQYLYHKRFTVISHADNKQTIEGAEINARAWPAKLDMEFGKHIGRIERIFYIYAFMLGQFSLLSAWVILKAFYGWIRKPSVARSGVPESEKQITTFYAYIYGNALSILAALILGHGGLILARIMNVVLLKS